MDALVLAAIRGNLLEGYFDQRFPVRLKKGGGLNNCIKDFAVNTFTAMVDTSVFTLFVLFQMFNAFNCRELGDESIFPNFFRNRLMLAAFVVCLGLQVIITQFGGSVFGTVPLDALSWLKVAALALSVVALDEIVRLIRRLVRRART